VDHFHLVEDGGAVIGDGNAALCVLDHLVHAPGSERRADGVGEGLGSADVGRTDLLGLGVLAGHEPGGLGRVGGSHRAGDQVRAGKLAFDEGAAGRTRNDNEAVLTVTYPDLVDFRRQKRNESANQTGFCSGGRFGAESVSRFPFFLFVA
jgi:hypothetical protein